MKKRVTALVMMVVLVACMSIPAFAASGISSDEQAVLDKFMGVVNKYATYLGTEHVNQYKAEAERVLIALDFDSAACTELSKGVDEMDSYLAGQGIDSKAKMKAALPGAVDIANKWGGKYFSIKVSVTDKGVASVTFTTPSPAPAPGQDIPAQENTATVTVNNGIINQTGVDTTATVAVLGGVALISLIGAGAFVASKSKKVAR